MSDTEKAALERRVDELCAEVEALKRDEWAAGFSAGCDAVEAAYEDGRPYYEVENAKLRDENARLRSCLSDDAENARMIMAENAKLRELVKKLIILAFARCADCDLLDASCALVPTQKCLLWNECESIARELGVEVDDG